ncbi:MAG: thioesterase [Lachnospiraceae bacterium]|nr:thioesterase [Lachnospiraceae bacterium]
MSNIYEEHLRVTVDETNMYRVMRTSTVFELMQQISIRQMEEFGIGRDKTLDKGLLWVILRQWAVIERLPEYDEQVTLRSWPGDMMHVIFPRHYEMVSAQGETLLRAQALWMLIDQNTRRHIFPDEYGIGVQGLVTGRELPPIPSIVTPGVKADKISETSGAAEKTEQNRERKLSSSEPGRDLNRPGDKTDLNEDDTDRKGESPKEFDIPIPYSMVDLNGHLNNTHYFDLAEDHSARAQSGIPLKEVQIEYLSEAKYGSTLHMKLETEGQADYFTATIGEKNCFRLKMTYDEFMTGRETNRK